jgi:hypothetical protein
MSSDHLSHAVSEIWSELLGLLSRLDQLGEHVAAAHLAAAIDALENRFDGAGRRLQDRTSDPVEAMALGLITHLGAAAVAAVRRQMTNASGQTLLVWAAIASRIDQIQARQTIELS